MTAGPLPVVLPSVEGDADAITSAAAKWRESGAEFSRAAGQLRASSADIGSSWLGSAATAARDAYGGVAELVDQGVRSFESAAQALTTYADAIEHAKSEMSTLEKKATSIEEDYQRVISSAESFRSMGAADLLVSSMVANAEVDRLDSTNRLVSQARAVVDQLKQAATVCSRELQSQLPNEIGGSSWREECGPSWGSSVSMDWGAFAARLMEARLRQEGLLEGTTEPLCREWLVNAARRGISVDDVISVAKAARSAGVIMKDFEILATMDRVRDPDGKSFFIIPINMGFRTTRKAVVLTYIFNAGTDYAAADGQANQARDGSITVDDFPETRYSGDELQRIIDRSERNLWSYSDVASRVEQDNGRMAATPNGILMAVGANLDMSVFSQNGGTTYGDVFIVNIDNPADRIETLTNIIEGGSKPDESESSGLKGSQIDLDRLLHHEEKHSQQWAKEGRLTFMRHYLTDPHKYEKDAGLNDGGYEG